MNEPNSAADTLQTAAHGGGHGEGFDFAHLLDHMKDGRYVEVPGGHVDLPQFPPVTIGGITLDLSPTKHVVFLLLAAILLTVWAVRAARAYRKHPVQRGMGNVLELMVLFIRDEVAIPNMGPSGLRYVPYLLTTFFFILIMNLLGLVPFGATATGNIAVTAGLAVIAFIMIQLSAIRAQGLGHYLAHLTGGVHWALWPIMVPIEILGLFTKPFALCIRLFANMTGGHIVIVSLIGLILLFRSLWVGGLSVGFTVTIMLLEIMVAFIQAYVFTMLTSLFMGLGMQAGHGEAHDGEHAH
ncbi:MAG: F0F1 ATP synthase subunit A [Bacteroidetes bacterium]|jgi:F-type H+-transporting ATPase subunit a|nr:F0F1 ATP synthase subunit A [Bacteroidota bacterium]